MRPRNLSANLALLAGGMIATFLLGELSVRLLHRFGVMGTDESAAFFPEVEHSVKFRLSENPILV